jgi:hypothetical protein
MRCDVAAVLEAFGRLMNAGYKRPELPRSIDELAQAYREVLSDLPAQAVLDGTLRFLRESDSRFWPKPAELRKYALAARRETATDTRSELARAYVAWEKRGWRAPDGALEPCPVCGAVLEPNGRIQVTHDLQRHREAGVVALR